MNDFFSEDPSTDTIYIEASEFISSDLQEVGSRQVVVVKSQEELLRQHEGTKATPACVRINVYQSELDPPNHFHIAVIYGTAIATDYEYRFEQDTAVLVEKTVEMGE